MAYMTPERTLSKMAWGGHDWRLALQLSVRGGARVMLRSTSFVLAMVFWCAQALAVSEEDRRNCSTAGDPKGRIEACTRVLADQAAPRALRTIAHRGRGQAYAGRRLYE